MAVLKLQEAVDARVKLDIDPLETAINDHLKTQRVVDYVTNDEITNPSIRVNVDGAQLTKAAQEALKASVEAAEWKSVEVIQTAKGVTVAFSKEEKDPPVPDVYVATVTADKTSVAIGAFAQLTVTVTKNGQPFPGAAPTYVSGTPAVATVNSSGKVTGVSAGTSVITVSEGSLYSKTITITVTGA